MEEGHVIASGVLRPRHNDEAAYPKQRDLAEQVDALLHKFHPSHLHIEDTYCGRNRKTFKDLVALGAMIIAAASAHNCRVTLWPPASWRSKVGIKDKTAVSIRLQDPSITFENSRPTSLDEQEACLIALAGYLKENYG